MNNFISALVRILIDQETLMNIILLAFWISSRPSVVEVSAPVVIIGALYVVTISVLSQDRQLHCVLLHCVVFNWTKNCDHRNCFIPARDCGFGVCHNVVNKLLLYEK